MDTAKRNKQNYLLAKAAFNARDLNACLAYYAPQHRIKSQQAGAPPPIRAFFEQTIATWPDIKINVEHAVAEDDWVMGRSIATATHANTVMGHAPTNKIVETSFWDLHRFNADGLIIESWNLMDALSIMQQIQAPPADSARTIASYESYAATYAALVNPIPSEFDANAMRRLAKVGGTILEIGSGPGTDADFIETLGVTVERTDATHAFLEIQAARGKRLNVLTDPLDGPYDGVMALCVLIHIGRDEIDRVLRNIFEAIRPGGAFLVSMRDGDHETFGDHHTIYWRRDGFAQRLEAVGFAIEWDEFVTDRSNEDWNAFLARRPG